MKLHGLLVVAGLAVSATAVSEVKELEGQEMVDTFVQGISIARPEADSSFAEDDQEIRDANDIQRSALGPVEPELVVNNATALDRNPTVDELVRNIESRETRDLVEDTIMQTSLSTRLDVNLDRLGAETGIPVADNANKDFSVLRGSILELLPSTTGYQFEFMKERY